MEAAKASKEDEKTKQAKITELQTEIQNIDIQIQEAKSNKTVELQENKERHHQNLQQMIRRILMQRNQMRIVEM